jgi:hypothetical protein
VFALINCRRTGCAAISHAHQIRCSQAGDVLAQTVPIPALRLAKRSAEVVRHH